MPIPAISKDKKACQRPLHPDDRLFSHSLLRAIHLVHDLHRLILHRIRDMQVYAGGHFQSLVLQSALNFLQVYAGFAQFSRVGVTQAVEVKLLIYAVISVGAGNSYGHPTEAVLSRLRDADVITFRTDLQGHIICTSDGQQVSFTVQRNADANTLEPDR